MADSAAAWLATLTSRLVLPPHSDEPSRITWIPRERMRRKALQEITDTLCRVAASDKRCAAEIRGANPDGGRITLDLLGGRCALNGAPMEAIGLVSRLQQWLEAHLQTAEIPASRVRRARVDIEYTVAERNYLERGRVWEMHFSLRSEIATDGRVYESSLPQCMSSVAYGASVLW